MTSTPPTSPNPFGDSAPKVDRVGLAANAMAAGMAVAVANISIVTMVSARLARASGITSRETIVDGVAVNFLIYGTVGSVFLAGLLAFYFMSPIDSNYRRGGLSMVSAFAGFLLSALLTMFVRGLLGETALLGLSVVATAVAVVFGRRARAAS